MPVVGAMSRVQATDFAKPVLAVRREPGELEPMVTPMW